MVHSRSRIATCWHPSCFSFWTTCCGCWPTPSSRPSSITPNLSVRPWRSLPSRGRAGLLNLCRFWLLWVVFTFWMFSLSSCLSAGDLISFQTLNSLHYYWENTMLCLSSPADCSAISWPSHHLDRPPTSSHWHPQQHKSIFWSLWR